MAEHTPFLLIFPGCADLADSCGGLDRAYVTDVLVNTAERHLTVSAWFPTMPSPVDLNQLRERLLQDYALSRVVLNPDYPAPVSASQTKTILPEEAATRRPSPENMIGL